MNSWLRLFLTDVLSYIKEINVNKQSFSLAFQWKQEETYSGEVQGF